MTADLIEQIRKEWNDGLGIKYQNAGWLIEKAEKFLSEVEKLRDENANLADAMSINNDIIDDLVEQRRELQDENERLRKENEEYKQAALAQWELDKMLRDSPSPYDAIGRLETENNQLREAIEIGIAILEWYKRGLYGEQGDFDLLPVNAAINILTIVEADQP